MDGNLAIVIIAGMITVYYSFKVYMENRNKK